MPAPIGWRVPGTEGKTIALKLRMGHFRVDTPALQQGSGLLRVPMPMAGFCSSGRRVSAGDRYSGRPSHRRVRRRPPQGRYPRRSPVRNQVGTRLLAYLTERQGDQASSTPQLGASHRLLRVHRPSRGPTVLLAAGVVPHLLSRRRLRRFTRPEFSSLLRLPEHSPSGAPGSGTLSAHLRRLLTSLPGIQPPLAWRISWTY